MTSVSMSLFKVFVAFLVVCVTSVIGESSPRAVAADSVPTIRRNHSRAGKRDRVHKKHRRNASKTDDDDEDDDEDEDEDVEVAGWLAFTAEGITKRQAKVGSRAALVQTFEVDEWDFTEFAVSEYEEDDDDDRRRAHRKGGKARRHRAARRSRRRHNSSRGKKSHKNQTKSAHKKKMQVGLRRLWDEDEPAWRVDWALSLDEDEAEEVIAIVNGLAKRIRKGKEEDFPEMLKQELTNAGAELPDDWELIGFGLTEDDDEDEDEEEEDEEDEDEDEDDEDEDEEDEEDEDDEDEDEEEDLGFDLPDLVCLAGNCFPKSQLFVLFGVAVAFFGMIGVLVAGMRAKRAGDVVHGVEQSELVRLERDRDDLAVTVGNQVLSQSIPSSWKGTVWGSGQGAASASPGGHQTTKRSYRLYFGPGGKLTGSGQDDFGNVFTVTGTYEIATGKVAWREDQGSSVVTECVGYLRICKSQGRSGQTIEARLDGENVWVSVAEYDPQRPFDGEGWYSYEIAGTYKAFDNYRNLGDGALELVSEAHQAPARS